MSYEIHGIVKSVLSGGALILRDEKGAWPVAIRRDEFIDIQRYNEMIPFEELQVGDDIMFEVSNSVAENQFFI